MSIRWFSHITKSETLQLRCSQKFAMVYPSNCTCSLSLGRQCPTARPTLMTTQGSTYIAAYGFFGSRFERAFFDVRVLNPCARSNGQISSSLLLLIGAMSRRRKDNMTRESEKWPWNTRHLHHWCYRLPGE